MRTNEALGKNFARFHVKPSVRALLCKEIGNRLYRFVVANGSLALVTVEYGNGKSPMALTRDTPIGSLSYHLHHTLSAPLRKPENILTGLGCRILEGVDRAEPLRSSSEYDGRLTSPAMRILVLYLLGCEKRSAFLHILKYRIVGYRIVQARKLSCVLGLIAAVVNGNDDINVVFATGLIVVCTESGSRMNATRTAIHGNIIRVYNDALSVKEGMLCGHEFKFLTRECSEHLVSLDSRGLQCFFGKSLCKNICLAILDLYKIVFLNGIECDSEISGERPGGSCPDYEICVIKVADICKLALVVGYLELNVNRGTLISLILDLRLSQSGLVLGTPINRLESLIDVSSLEHLSEDLYLCRLKVG